MELVEQLCDQLAVVALGRVVAAGSLDAVRAGESLQQRFLDLLGVAVPSEGVLTWLQSSSGSN